MNPSGWGAAEWSAFGQVGALVLAVVGGVLVWLQIRHGQQVREDQTRPYIILDFEFRHLATFISIRNIGTTPASNVSIEFDKPLQSPNPSARPGQFAVFAEPIPMMAPGRSMEVFSSVVVQTSP